jgi:cysteine-rich repeat protein
VVAIAVVATGLVAVSVAGCSDDDSSSGPICGNQIVETGETCDDGNTVDGDGCSATCQTEVAICGNGVMEGAEQCDDGNTVDGDGCSATCQNEVAACGNGTVETPEVCDDGNTTGGDGCSADCRSDETCGNGIVDGDAGETCDDGNEDNTDACPDGVGGTCETATCGDGFVQAGAEMCDDGNTVGDDGCSADCQSDETCGNGIVDGDAGETCDDGNEDNTDACPDGAGGTCQTAACGDGFVQSGVETCDDGNGVNTDACPDGAGGTCQDAGCGDGFVWAGQEGCDDSNTTAGDGCSDTCQMEGCGNGVVDAGETCDDGNQDNTDACPDGTGGTCQAARCGDGFVQSGVETCDDGNATNTDACPDGAGGTCQDAECGDGFEWAGQEVCDDGDTTGGDGCSADCQSDETCGNGIVDGDAGETCDDGNGVNTDACPDGAGGTCETATCGDGFVQAGTEECDDGNLGNNDGCSATCDWESCLNASDCGDTSLYVCDVATQTCRPSQCTYSSTSCGVGCTGTDSCCLEQTAGSDVGACYDVCDPYDLACPGSLECLNLRFNQGIGRCLQAGTSTVGQFCSSSDTGTGCAAGATCLDDGTNNRCYEVCDFFGTPTCSGGNTCYLGGYCDTPPAVSHNVAFGATCPSGATNGEECAPNGDGFQGGCYDLGAGMICYQFCQLSSYSGSVTPCQSGTCQEAFNPPLQGDVGLCI